MTYRMEAACGSHIGLVRSNNEDNFLFDGTYLPQQNAGQTPPLTLYRPAKDGTCMAIFDGMGGGDYGEAASYTAAVHLAQLLGEGFEDTSPESGLDNAVLQLNLAVCGAQKALGTNRMGSTMAALYFSGSGVYACNVGDSRIFGLRENRLVQISKDHTDEEYMKQQGIAGRRPRLTQHLGMDPEAVCLEPHILRGELRPGDLYLICSDGLTDMLTPDEIRQILISNGTASASVTALIAAALKNGGRDNVTVIVCRVLDPIPSAPSGDSPAAEPKTARSHGVWDNLREIATDPWRNLRKNRH